MRETKLYICTTSDSPDPYINVIAHCAEYFKPLIEVVLLGIIEDRGKINGKLSTLSELKDNIGKQLDCLSKGKYLQEENGCWKQVDIKIKPADSERYNNLKDIKLRIKVLDYQELDEEVSSLLNPADLYTYLFDVTAVLKRYLVRLFKVLSVNSVSGVYSFELVNKPIHDDRDLIHNLEFNRTYKYLSLNEDEYTNDKITMGKGPIISRQEYDELTSACKMAENNLERLENRIATNFARRILMVYPIIGFSLLILMCRFIFWLGGWSWIEPLTYMVPFGLYLVYWTSLSIFSGIFPSNPKELFVWLKDWKKRRLEKFRSYG